MERLSTTHSRYKKLFFDRVNKMEWFELLKNAEEDAESFYQTAVKNMLDFSQTAIKTTVENINQLEEDLDLLETSYEKLHPAMQKIMLPAHTNQLNMLYESVRELKDNLKQMTLLVKDIRMLEGQVASMPISARLMVMRETFVGMDEFIDADEITRIINNLSFEGRDDLR